MPRGAIRVKQVLYIKPVDRNDIEMNASARQRDIMAATREAVCNLVLRSRWHYLNRRVDPCRRVGDGGNCRQ